MCGSLFSIDWWWTVTGPRSWSWSWFFWPWPWRSWPWLWPWMSSPWPWNYVRQAGTQFTCSGGRQAGLTWVLGYIQRWFICQQSPIQVVTGTISDLLLWFTCDLLLVLIDWLIDASDNVTAAPAAGHRRNVQSTHDEWQKRQHLALSLLCRWVQ